nr:hypothetical protein [Pandoravirus aubagnensis]
MRFFLYPLYPEPMHYCCHAVCVVCVDWRATARPPPFFHCRFTRGILFLTVHGVSRPKSRRPAMGEGKKKEKKRKEENNNRPRPSQTPFSGATANRVRHFL